MIDKAALKHALKSCVPVVMGYFPASFAYGLLLTGAGYSMWLAVLMSVVIYAGAGQFLAVSMLSGGVPLTQVGVMTFLINSKHLFYGLSLLDDYKNVPWYKKLYLVFALTDETYAILTQPSEQAAVNRTAYCLYLSALNHSSWILGSLAGALLGTVVAFNAAGLEFAMISLFIVICIEQWKAYKSKLPFALGTGCALVALPIVGRSNMLLAGTVMAALMLISLRKKVENSDDRH